MAYTKSVKSVRSIRSVTSGLEKGFREERKGDGDLHSFDNMLIMACQRFQCPYAVNVMKEIKPDYYKNIKQANQIVKAKRMSIMPQTKVPVEPETKNSTESDLSDSVETTSFERAYTIIVTMIYDNYNTLTEIEITKVMDIPRTLLRIISLLLPYYRTLTRMTISKCGIIDMYTIYELTKVLKGSTITEICLDGSPLAGGDYTMLLDTTKVKFLSLCRCSIQDDSCKLIAIKLQHAGSAQNLLLLNLSSNRITDEGAKHIGNALRTNRHLRYLNLADNHISDCGAGRILDVLIQFPLTSEEILNMRRRHMEYYRRRNALYQKNLAYLYNKSLEENSQLSRKAATATAKKRKTSLTTLRSARSSRKEKDIGECDEYLKTKADMMTAEILGPFEDPFHPKSVKHIDTSVYSIGNLSLAYLNLAFNNLSYLSIIKLQKVTKHQSNYRLKGGLIKVVLQGNNLPISCPELNVIGEVMARGRGRISEIISKPHRAEK